VPFVTSKSLISEDGMYRDVNRTDGRSMDNGWGLPVMVSCISYERHAVCDWVVYCAICFGSVKLYADVLPLLDSCHV